MKTTISISICAFLLAACESSPKPKEPPRTEPPASKTGVSIDGDVLVEEAQLLRDREFARKPSLARADDYDPPVDVFCDGSCQRERESLRQVMFGGRAIEGTEAPAYWDADAHAVVWDPASDDVGDLERAVVAALVEGLDREASPPPKASSTWDGAHAVGAATRGPGVFVTFLREAIAEADHVDAPSFAARPEVLVELPRSEPYLGEFASREGFVFAAALHRAGGWSAVELSHNRPPKSSAHVVRPDRYLEGYDLGTWKWSAEATDFWRSRDYAIDQSGMIGPAVFVEWLSGHIPPAVARTAYLGWESDTYRVWRPSKGGDDDGWRWEWVSLWNAPSTSQQIVEALDAGLREQGGGSRYTVLRKGTTVAVLGSAETLTGDELKLAPTLVEMRPVFEADGGGVGLAYVPTPTDRLLSRAQVTRVDPEEWTDEVTGVSADLRALKEWTITPTKEPPLPWFAKHDDGTILQWHVEPKPLLAPRFEAPEYARHLQAKFAESLEGAGTPKVARTSVPTKGAVVVDVSTRADDPTKMTAWHFATGPYVVTVSVQASAEAYEARRAEAEALLASVDVPGSPGDEADGGGIIRFEVEE